MKRALILSGGGARAAYQVGVLQALAEILPDESPNPFPIICGTSAGAINALALAAHQGTFKESVHSLATMWRNLTVGDVYLHSWWDIFKGLGFLGADASSVMVILYWRSISLITFCRLSLLNDVS